MDNVKSNENLRIEKLMSNILNLEKDDREYVLLVSENIIKERKKEDRNQKNAQPNKTA